MTTHPLSEHDRGAKPVGHDVPMDRWTPQCSAEWLEVRPFVSEPPRIED